MEQLQTGVARGVERPRLAKTEPKAFRLSQRLTAIQIEEVVAAYQGGMTSPQLTQRFSMGKGSVLKVLHEAGAIPPRRGLTKSQKQLSVELYAAGWSLSKIADK